MDESRYGTAAGEWLMRDPRCRVAGPLSKRNKGQKKKKKSRNRRNVSNDFF